MTWVLRSRSLHYLSTVRTVSVSIEETYGVFQRRWTQVHVHLGRCQVPVAGQFLDRLRRGAPHRQVRAEGVSQQMNAGVGKPCLVCGPANESLDHLLRQRPTIVPADDPGTTKMPVDLQGPGEPAGQRDVPPNFSPPVMSDSGFLVLPCSGSERLKAA